MAQAPRKGPGTRTPKKRGPGRPPKKNPEELPDYCPEFLDPKLVFKRKKITENPRKLELVCHFRHIKPVHTIYREELPNYDQNFVDIPTSEEYPIQIDVSV